MKDYIDYILTSPYKQLSSATKAFHRLYRKMIKLTKIEIADKKAGMVNESISIEKRFLQKKLYAVRKAIPTRPDRDKYRKSTAYQDIRQERYLKKIDIK